MPEISVVVPSYNYDKYIGQTLHAVLEQTFEDLELIVVDDGSQDNSLEVIRDCARCDGRVRLKVHERNCGIARTFNDGIDTACGKYVAICGCDDVWVADKLEKQLAVLREDEDLVVYSDTMVIDGEGKVMDRQRPSTRKPAQKSGRILTALLEGNFVCGSSMIFKRENLNGTRFDERYRYVNDYKFVLDLAERYSYFFVDEPLVKYRVHGGNVTLRDKTGWLRDFAVLAEYILETYPDVLTSKARAKYLYKIARDAMARGDVARGRTYLLRAMAVRPFRGRYWKMLLGQCVKGRRRAS